MPPPAGCIKPWPRLIPEQSLAMKILAPGLLLTAVAWAAAWGRFGIVTEFSFFPLWLGYILALNGMSEALLQRSLIRRMGPSFLALFIFSVPLWWFFELMNSFVHNWHYVFAQPISDLQYSIQASIDFSTVIPAVLSTDYCFHQLLLRRSRFAHCTPVRLSRSHLFLFVLVGIFAFCIIPLFSNETFPLVWIAPLLLLEPLAYVAGTPSFLRLLEQGQCRLAVAIMAATCSPVFGGRCGTIIRYRNGLTQFPMSTSGEFSRCRFWDISAIRSSA